LQLEAVALVAVGVGSRADDRAGQRRGLRDPLDRDLALEANLVPGDLGLLGREADLGMPLGVEELGREKVCVQVLVLDLQGRDARGARQAAVLEGGVEIGDGAAERADAHVLHLERDRGVDAICTVRPGRKRGALLGDAHCRLTSRRLTTQAYVETLAHASYSPEGLVAIS